MWPGGRSQVVRTVYEALNRNRPASAQRYRDLFDSIECSQCAATWRGRNPGILDSWLLECARDPYINHLRYYYYETNDQQLAGAIILPEHVAAFGRRLAEILHQNKALRRSRETVAAIVNHWLSVESFGLTAQGIKAICDWS
jgi:hypothetical protein